MLGCNVNLNTDQSTAFDPTIKMKAKKKTKTKRKHEFATDHSH